MRFGDRVRERREELGLTRPQLAERLGISLSAVSNYETGVSFPKEEVMLRLFDCLETEPDVLFQDSFRGGAGCSPRGSGSWWSSTGACHPWERRRCARWWRRCALPG